MNYVMIKVEDVGELSDKAFTAYLLMLRTVSVRNQVTFTIADITKRSYRIEKLNKINGITRNKFKDAMQELEVQNRLKYKQTIDKYSTSDLIQADIVSPINSKKETFIMIYDFQIDAILESYLEHDQKFGYIKVLAALLTFKGNETHSAYPSYHRIRNVMQSEHYYDDYYNRATKALEELNIIYKFNLGFKVEDQQPKKLNNDYYFRGIEKNEPTRKEISLRLLESKENLTEEYKARLEKAWFGDKADKE